MALGNKSSNEKKNSEEESERKGAANVKVEENDGIGLCGVISSMRSSPGVLLRFCTRKGRVDMADMIMAFASEEEKQIVEPELINYSGTKSNGRLESSRPDGARKKSKLDGDKMKKSKLASNLDGDKKKSKLDAYKLKPEIDYGSFDYDNFPVKQWMQMFRKFTSLEMMVLMDYQRRLLKSGKTKYHVVKFLKANYSLHAYEYKEYYYITFQARDVACSEHSLPKNFQALVGAGEDEATVDFCRPEP